MPELIGSHGNEKALKLGLKTLLTSLGFQSAGALTLFNYPTWMRHVTPQNEDGTDRAERVDMASLDSNIRFLSKSNCLFDSPPSGLGF